jgi:uncharacterized protein (TIGR00730 family)
MKEPPPLPEPTPPNRDVKRALLREAWAATEDGLERLDLKMLASATHELRTAFAAFAPHRQRRRATVFGSARTSAEDPAWLLAHETGRLLAEADWMVITGGGPGIMDAAASGAGSSNAFGVNIRLPHEQPPSPSLEPEGHLIEMKYFFTRKVLMVKESHGFLSFPGGLGTLDETFELLTLMQTGKAQLAPLVLVEPPGSDYFDHLERFLRDVCLRETLINQSDLALYRRATSADAAVAEVTSFYANYDSARMVGDLLVLRMQRAPRGASLAALQREYADLCSHGTIESIAPTPWEVREHDCTELERLAFFFTRHDYGRLRMLIDRLNQ